MEGLLSTLKQDIPALYASETLQQRKEQVLQARRREQRLLEQFEKRLAPHFGLLWHDADAALVPELATYSQGASASGRTRTTAGRRAFPHRAIGSCAPAHHAQREFA